MFRLSPVILSLFVCAPAILAQGRSPAVADSSAVRIMARVGPRGADAVWLRDILRQAGAQQPQAKLDEIADSLVNRAIGRTGGQPLDEARRQAVDAVNALMQAGSKGTAWSGRAYPGALDRMITVHRQASAHGVRARALIGMLGTPSHARAVDYLRQVAESGDATAYDAIEALIDDANGGSWTGIPPTASERAKSVSALNTLASGDLVKDRRAANLLDMWIQRSR